MTLHNYLEKDNKKIYDIISEISNGATCLCVLGKAPSNEKEIAIKLYENKEIYEKDKKYTLIFQEHPSFLSLIDSGSAIYNKQEKDKNIKIPIFYEVLEYCKTGDLYTFLNQNDRPLSVSLIKKLFRQIISGVIFMHDKNIAHFDIKPQNILLDDDLNVKIIDFGSSQTFKDKNEKYIGKFLGTKLFCSREYKQSESKGINLFKFDVFALGVTLFCLFTKKNPFVNYSLLEKEGGTLQENGYSYIIKKKKEKFWRSYERVPENAKDLIFRMLADKEKDRIDLGEVINHHFFLSENE